MTLPVPAPADVLRYTDVYIKALAVALDDRIGRASKISMLNPTTVTTDANGAFWAVFPGLGQVAGAIVQAAGAYAMKGAKTEYPPVPPASIGRVLFPTQPTLTIYELSTNGIVVVRCYTCPTDGGTYNSVRQVWGGQQAVANQQVRISGIAWGPA